MTAIKTLINFNVPSETLQTFDNVCRLNGMSRSQVLNDLLYKHILEVGAALPSRLDQVRQIGEKLKTEIKRSVAPASADLSAGSSNGVQNLGNPIFGIAGKDAKSSEVC